MKLKQIIPFMLLQLAIVFSVQLLSPPYAFATERPRIGHELNLKLNGTPVYLGRIDATGASETNAQAGSAFPESGDLEGKTLYVETSADCDFKPVQASNTVITAANSPEIRAGSPKVFGMALGYKYLAAVGTCNLDVFELL